MLGSFKKGKIVVYSPVSRWTREKRIDVHPYERCWLSCTPARVAESSPTILTKETLGRDAGAGDTTPRAILYKARKGAVVHWPQFGCRELDVESNVE